MYYVAACPACGQGLLGIRICCGGPSGLIVCDECEATWFDPARESGPYFPAQPESGCPRCGQPLWAPPSHWASAAEIEQLGWLEFVVGDRAAY